METKTIETPIGKNVIILKSFITMDEEKAIKRIMKDVDVTVENKIGEKAKQVVKPFNMADKLEETENKAIETIVISVDGKTENILEELGKMNSKDGNFIKKEINKITEDEDFLEE